MKYLKYKLYEKVCSVDGEKYEGEWEEQYNKFLNEFNQLSDRLPKLFLTEFKKHHFHDNILNFISIEKIKIKKGYKYFLTMNLLDYHDENLVHNLVFSDVKNFSSNLNFGSFAGNCDWLYCEILAIDEKRLSLEVILFDDSVIYLDFSKLRYRKIRRCINNDRGSTYCSS